jgi:hypothetical protein
MLPLLLCVAGTAAVTTDGEWSAWTAAHSKSFASPGEEAHRRSVFAQNIEDFAERTRFDSATYGADQYADLTMDEFVAARAGCFTDDDFHLIPEAPTADLTLAAGVPPSVDWRDPAKNPAKVNGVTRVKNQGAYGYCWAFGASGTLEGMNAIQQKNPLVELSEQVSTCSSAAAASL